MGLISGQHYYDFGVNEMQQSGLVKTSDHHPNRAHYSLTLNSDSPCTKLVDIIPSPVLFGEPRLPILVEIQVGDEINPSLIVYWPAPVVSSGCWQGWRVQI